MIGGTSILRVLTGLVSWAPILTVLIVAIVIAIRTRHTHPRRAGFTIAGALVMLLGDLIRMFWSYVVIQQLWELDVPLDLFYAGVSVFFAGLDTVGLGLLVWAIFVAPPEPSIQAFT